MIDACSACRGGLRRAGRGENSQRGFCALVVLPRRRSAAHRQRTEDVVPPQDERRAGLVEPMSWDTVEETLASPLARVAAGSPLLTCLPSGLSAEPARGLGSQPGPARILQLAEEAGFSHARVATSSPRNRVFDLAP